MSTGLRWTLEEYEAWKKNGSVMSADRANAFLKFKKNFIVNMETGCWLWNAARGKSPYGKVRMDGKAMNCHRVSWTLYRGEIPEGLQVLHKCDVQLCVNPDHLFLGTQKDNMVDAVQKKRHRHCVFQGEEHPAAKLTETQVQEIRKDRGLLKDLAKKYHVSKATISGIRRGKTWKVTSNDGSSHETPYLERPIRDESVGAAKADQLDKKFRIHFHSKRRRLADPDGISAKAAIDGLREGGIFVDDSTKYVQGVSFSQENSKTEETVIEIWEEVLR